MIIMWSVNANESIKYNKKLDSQCYLQVSFQILFENLLSQETFENMMRWFWFGCKSYQNNVFLNNAVKVLISILSHGATHGGQCLSIMNCHFDHERVLWNAVRTKICGTSQQPTPYKTDDLRSRISVSKTTQSSKPSILGVAIQCRISLQAKSTSTIINTTNQQSKS